MATLYHHSGTRIIVWTKEASNNNTTFTANGWAINTNNLYYGVFPYNEEALIKRIPFTALPITYTTQQQTSNDNTAHLSKYDYMTTQATTGDENVTFNFTHLGSIVRFNIQLPETQTLTSLTLTADEDIFTTEATMNVTNNTTSATKKEKSIVLGLGNIEIEKDGNLVAYMMIAPGEYNGKITITLANDNGKTATANIGGTTIDAGKAYDIEVTTLTPFRGDGTLALNSKLTQEAQLAKAISTTPEATATTSIQYPKGYAPDFPFDTEHSFTEILLMGDANNDGEITMADANLTANNSLGDDETYICYPQADMDGDGIITMQDAEAIVSLYLKK